MCDLFARVAIIGGYGKLGSWLARFLLGEGLDVTITGRDTNRLHEAGKRLGTKVATNEEATKDAEAVVVSVPISSFEQVISQIAPYTRRGQVIMDVTSIKEMPVQVMHRYIKQSTVLGTHPMFGPGAESIRGQKFVLTPTSEDEHALAEKLKGYLESKGAGAISMSPQEHDRSMSIVLALSHFIALISADTLLSLDKFKDLMPVGGITYRMLLTLAESVVTEDPDFYASLQMNLPDVAGIEKQFIAIADEWARLVADKDAQHFAQRMIQLKEKFVREVPDFAEAYKTMYRILEQQ